MSEEKIENVLAQWRKDPRAATHADVVAVLKCSEEEGVLLFGEADRLRQEHHGDSVHLRGLIEISNFCRKNCGYCGIRRGNAGIPRYRMKDEEILSTALLAVEGGCGTVVLQSGEDVYFTVDRLSSLLEQIRESTGLAVTLSIGERSAEEYAALAAAGCDRFLLRFETADRNLFARMHPEDDFDSRIRCLEAIRRAGIQTGSGFMIGLPDGGVDVIAGDIIYASSLNLDMIGCGPFIPNPATPMGSSHLIANQEVYFRTISILRMLNPLAHIPATTAFDVLYAGARDRILQIGGNVFMPNLTPAKYREAYLLYPDKPGVDQDGKDALSAVVRKLENLGRPAARGPGHSLMSER